MKRFFKILLILILVSGSIIAFLGYVPFETKNETLKNRIITYRKLNGLTQFQFAKLVEVDPTTIFAIEKGERKVSTKVSLKIFEKLKELYL